MVSQKYAKANYSKVKRYDVSKPASHILYLDANNLYGWALCQEQPTGMFRFLEEKDMKTFDVHKVLENSNNGYILEVDLEYPRERHEQYNCCPLAPTHKSHKGGTVTL